MEFLEENKINPLVLMKFIELILNENYYNECSTDNIKLSYVAGDFELKEFLLLENLPKGNLININYGEENEWYGDIYICPQCEKQFIWDGFKYCPMCGIELKWPDEK
jgi:rRNA maturation endonuclease Nob1